MTDCKGEERTTAEKGNKKIFLWQIRCWKNVSSGKNSATHQHEGKEKVESANIALSCSLLCPENSQLKCFWPALRDVIEVTIYLPLIVANASSDCLQKKTLKKNTKKTLKKYRKGFVFFESKWNLTSIEEQRLAMRTFRLEQNIRFLNLNDTMWFEMHCSDPVAKTLAAFPLHLE